VLELSPPNAPKNTP